MELSRELWLHPLAVIVGLAIGHFLLQAYRHVKNLRKQNEFLKIEVELLKFEMKAMRSIQAKRIMNKLFEKNKVNLN